MLEDSDVKDYILKYVKENYVERRDNPLDKLPHFVEPHKFYIEEFNKYKNKLEQFKSLTDEEAKEEEIAYRKNQKDEYEKYITGEKQKVEGLIHKLKKIQEWNCPDSLKESKNYMLQDIDLDIVQHTKHMNYRPSIDTEVTGKEFKEEMIRRYQRIVDDLSYNVKTEQAWVDKTNEMFNDLKISLGNW